MPPPSALPQIVAKHAHSPQAVSPAFPKGSQILAGGRSTAQTSGAENQRVVIPEAWQIEPTLGLKQVSRTTFSFRPTPSLKMRVPNLFHVQARRETPNEHVSAGCLATRWNEVTHRWRRLSVLMVLYLPDANVLIHALRKGSVEHEACRAWLTGAAAAGDRIGLCEMVEAALLRIPTIPRLKLIPMTETLGFWKEDLWTYPGTLRCADGDRHRGIFSTFITDLGLTGNGVNDAWLAALANESRATLVSTDQGFDRFPGLTWINPVKSA